MRTLVYDGWVARAIDADDYIGVLGMPGDIGQIAAWALDVCAENVWLLPCPLLRAAMRRDAFWCSGAIVGADVTTLGDPAEPTGAIVRRGGRIAARIMRADDPRWGLGDLYINDLAAVLLRLRALLGTDPAISPQTTGIRLLHRSGALAIGAQYPTCPSPEPAADNLAYVRAVEREYRWLHVIDRNAAYLNAARNATFGAGMPEYRDRPIFDAATHGLWRLAAPLGDGDWRLPDGGLPRAAWHDSATLELACRLDYAPRVRDAWVWPEGKRALRAWGDTLASARGAATGATRDVVKSIATTTIGMFNHKREGELTAWYRPHWWAHICAVNCLTVALVTQRLEAEGHAVMAANTDMIAVLSDDRNLPPWLEISDRIGKWKYERLPQKAEYWQRIVRNGATLRDWLGQWQRR